MIKCMKMYFLNIYILISLLIFKLRLMVIKLGGLLSGINSRWRAQNKLIGIGRRGQHSGILQFQRGKNNKKNKI